MRARSRHRIGTLTPEGEGWKVRAQGKEALVQHPDLVNWQWLHDMGVIMLVVQP